MKIAYFVPYLVHSGPVAVVYYLVQELHRYHDIDIYYFKDIDRLKFPVPTHKISLYQKIDFDRYDILHSHGVIPDIYLWWHNSSIHRAKCVTTLHNYVREDYRYGYNPIKAYILQRVWNIATSKHDKVVALSKDAMEYYREFWINPPSTYAYNGIPIDVDMERRELYGDDTHTKLGLIGSSNISKIKGFDQAIMAIKYMPNFSLYIAGGGGEVDRLRDLAISLGVESRVYFVGVVDDIDSFIYSMDIVAVTSYSEGFSLALQEIVRAKRAVVVSDIPIFRELFDSDEVSRFELDDRDSFISSVKYALQNRDMIDRAYEKFATRYRSTDMAKRYLEIYTA
ncbi:Poly(glycerol-phosphate) alpha-glucosyltransferase [hydrothermal vent metagenome]|uniref:Poly(Glycerol-phosphate) alpha-glucosyltransferase n=1 Tax=hydrothermal vent metagenome TaxID=652676 RepID=A0A1W1BTE6_9ZZZZ